MSDITIQEITKEAIVIWEKFCLGVKENKEDTEIYKIVSFQHKKFNQCYPIVLKQMMIGNFGVNIFTQFIEYVIQNPWKDERDFIYAQAEYVTLLHSTNLNKKKKIAYREKIRKNLWDEHMNFVNMYNAAKLKVSQSNQDIEIEMRKELIAWAKLSNSTKNST